MSADSTDELPNLSGSEPSAGRDKGGIIERAVRRVSDRRDLVVWEGEPVVPGPALAYAHDPGSLRSEYLRSLRTELLMRIGSQRGAATFAIVGPRPGEGRSQLCAELALAFAQLAGKTLLVDADLRQPKLDKLFTGARTNAGLSDVLLSKAPTLPLRRVVGAEALSLLAAGPPPPNSADLLSSSQFERLTADWARTYDYVLIDTPPAALSSDGILVAHAVINVVLVTRKDHTSYNDITELQRRLEATQARIVGAVLNEF